MTKNEEKTGCLGTNTVCVQSILIVF